MISTVRLISIFAIAAGVPLVAAPWWWPGIVAGRQSWTDQQAKEYSQAAANYHRLIHEAGHAADQVARQTSAQNSHASKDAVTKAEQLSLDASDASAAYNRQRAALDQARAKGQSTAMIMRYVGIALIIAACFGWAASRPLSVTA